MPDMLKAIIFDLDGVIIDSNPAIEKFWHHWAAQEGVTLTDELIRRHIHGRKGTETIRDLFPHVSAATKEAIRESANVFDSEMKPGAIPGVVDFIHGLHDLGMTTGVVTSSHKGRMLKMLDKHQLQHYFTSFITANDVSKGKPDPEPYLKMSELLDITPAQCLVFEDATGGIQAAVAAGMHAIGIGKAAIAEALRQEGAMDVIPDFTHMRITTHALFCNGHDCFTLS